MHVISLLRRYRELLGQCRYVRKEDPENEGQIASLANAISALAEAIQLLEPGISLSALRPILFRPVEPLPRGALKREILNALRVSEDGHAPVGLIDALVETHALSFACEEEASRFKGRVINATEKLFERQIIQRQGGCYSV